MSSQAAKTVKTSNETCSSNERTKNKKPRHEDPENPDARHDKEDGLLDIQEGTNFDEFVSRTFGDLNEPRNVGVGSNDEVTVMSDVININIIKRRKERVGELKHIRKKRRARKKERNSVQGYHTSQVNRFILPS